MANFTSAEAIGSLVDPDAIRMDRITADALFQVLEGMDAKETREFECALRLYQHCGEASEFLLGVFAVAAGRRCGRSGHATAFQLQPNVIGVVFAEN